MNMVLTITDSLKGSQDSRGFPGHTLSIGCPRQLSPREGQSGVGFRTRVGELASLRTEAEEETSVLHSYSLRRGWAPRVQVKQRDGTPYPSVRGKTSFPRPRTQVAERDRRSSASLLSETCRGFLRKEGRP